MIDGARQTGRTTRMMQEAIRAAWLGHTVAIVGATEHEVSQLKQLYQKYNGPLTKRVLWFTIYQLDKAHGLDEDIVVFKDHHAVEVEAQNYASALRMARQDASELRGLLNSIIDIAELGTLP